MDNRLFVYGSLAPGRPNEHVLADLPGTWQPAVVRGELTQHGWGAAMGFPALVLGESGPPVDGQLFTSDALPEHWVRLDDFEGPAYERVQAEVTRADGTTTSAYVYVARNDG